MVFLFACPVRGPKRRSACQHESCLPPMLTACIFRLFLPSPRCSPTACPLSGCALGGFDIIRLISSPRCLRTQAPPWREGGRRCRSELIQKGASSVEWEGCVLSCVIGLSPGEVECAFLTLGCFLRAMMLGMVCRMECGDPGCGEWH